MGPKSSRRTAGPLMVCCAAFVSLAQDPVATRAWFCGFENGLTGWDGPGAGWVAPGGSPSAGATEAWTIQTEFVYAGTHTYKGWIITPKTDSHRAYPCVSNLGIPSPWVNSWYVYLDTDYRLFSQTEWHHFATWANNPEWRVHTMAVRSSDGLLEMAHVNGFERVGDCHMPLRRWVRFTAYVNYAPTGDNVVFVWMDGVPIMRGYNREAGGADLCVAHWGLYGSGSLDQGVQYNDDIQVWTLSAPWTDFDREPQSPYASGIAARQSRSGQPLRIAPGRRAGSAFGLDGRRAPRSDASMVAGLLSLRISAGRAPRYSIVVPDR